MKAIQVLLVTKSEELMKNITSVLVEHYGEAIKVHRVGALQDAIEKVEMKELVPDLVLVEQKSSAHSILKLLFELLPYTGTIVMSEDENILSDLMSIQSHANFISLNDLENDLPKSLKKLEALGKVQAWSLVPESEFISVESDRILAMKPLPIDIYIKAPSGKHVKIFRHGDEVLSSDLSKYLGQAFYLRRVDCDRMFGDQVNQIEAITAAEPIDPVKAKRVADMSQELVRTLVTKVGFTEEAQRIAKASVSMSLKLIGSKPRLSMILTELKKKEGNFVTSHSFLMGQLACAMAYTVGWRSTSTYFKLSMASFLHDIALNLPTLEQEVTYEEAVASGHYEAEELKTLRFHPIKAAEYTRQFSEIPVDVEQIVAQHHERPNGVGYPRGLSSKYISPLSAIFILAHDLILFMMKNPEAKVEKFYDLVEIEFNQNPFRKIIAELKANQKAE